LLSNCTSPKFETAQFQVGSLQINSGVICMLESKDTCLILSPDAMPSTESLTTLENLPHSFSVKLGLSYHVDAAKYFVTNTNFKEKNVLEIGGSSKSTAR
jgi:hypothetical protein